jgi:hypothetical protein
VLLLEPRDGVGHHGGQRRGERGEAGAARAQAGERVELAARPLDPAEDLLRAGGEQAPGLREPDAAPVPLQQRDPRWLTDGCA